MIEYSRTGSVAVLDLDDGKANALSHAFIGAMNEGLDRAESEAKAVVLVGRPGRFSAGFDLKEFQKGPDQIRALLTAGAELLTRLFAFPQPVVAACTGHAIAAGAMLLMTADSRVAAQGDFKIGLNEAAIGMVIPPFGMILSQHRLAATHLQAAVIQARMYGPDGARDAGFVDEVVEPERVRDRGIEIARGLVQLSMQAYAGNKLKLREDTIARLEASIPLLASLSVE